MRIFMSGATGFIGSAILRELLGAGHQVTGLARSEASVKQLIAAGAQVHLGTIEDLDSLRSAAAAADGVVHTAYYHQVSHMRLRTRLGVLLGGRPSAIVARFIAAAVGTDRQALEVLGKALKGSERPLVAAFGTLALKPDQVVTETNAYDPNSVGGLRGASEDAMRSLASLGVRTSVIRLPPIVHGAEDRAGFAPQLIKIARKKGESAYVGNGENRWPSVHRLDAARLFRLALEKGSAGGTYHGVAEEGVPFRDIASTIAKHLDVPLVSKSPTEGAKHFGFLAPLISVDNPTSSKLTEKRLGWQAAQPGLITDLAASYF